MKRLCPPKGLLKNLKRNLVFTQHQAPNPNSAAFLEFVSKEIQEIKVSHRLEGNLTDGESRALKSLMQNQLITIKPADKGGNIVIQDSTDYVRMCKNILDNPE